MITLTREIRQKIYNVMSLPFHPQYIDRCVGLKPCREFKPNEPLPDLVDYKIVDPKLWAWVRLKHNI